MSSRRAAFVAVMCGLALSLAGCGGSSKGSLLSQEPTAVELQAGFDVQRADELAHAAMLVPADLPGFTWDVISDRYDDDAIHRQKACAGSAALLDEQAKVRSGRASGRMTRKTGSGSANVNVGEVIEIYPTATQAKTFFDKAKAYDSSPAALACYDAILRDAGGSLSFTTKLGSPLIKTPAGVSVIVIEVALAQPPSTLHLEVYHLQLANAVISSTIGGPKENVTAEVVQTALDKQRAAAEDAARGKRQKSP